MNSAQENSGQVGAHPYVRGAVMADAMSIRKASRVFGRRRDAVRKMLAHPIPQA